MSYKDWDNETLLNFLASRATPTDPKILTVNDGDISIHNIKRELLRRLEALKIWQDWFEWSGDPWEANDYGDVDCFFCREDQPNHTPECAYVRAKALIEAMGS